MASFRCKLHVRTIFYSGVRGQKGGQNGSSEEPFGYISKSFQYFGLIFGMKGALMVLNACVNYGVLQKSGFRVRGQKGGQNGSSEEPFGFSSKSLIRILLILCM